MAFYSVALNPLPSFISAGVATGLGGYRHAARTLHAHELFLVEAGTLHIAADGARTDVKAGGILFHPAGVWQEGAARSSDGVKFAWLHFAGTVRRAEPDADRIREQLAVRGPRRAEPEREVLIPERCTPGYFLELLHVAYALAERAQRYAFERSLLVNLLLCRVSSSYFSEVRDLPATRAGRIVEDVRYWVGKTLREPVSPRDIARCLRMNPDYLTRVFKRETGQTISGYITTRKMEKAKQDLASGKSVKASAAGCGFVDVKHFARRFKRYTGLTPSRFQAISGSIYRN